MKLGRLRSVHGTYFHHLFLLKRLVGKINLFSPDHVSLLVHRTFNISIPRHHIPSDVWEFAYGPAENDPEFGPKASAVEDDVDMESNTTDQPAETTAEDEGPDSIGRWIHHSTSETMGGQDGFVEFTVVGYGI
jgi:DNA-directed RNA polymerase I subunit RPA43